MSRRQQDAQEFLQLVLERVLRERGLYADVTAPAVSVLRGARPGFVGALGSQVVCLQCGHAYPMTKHEFNTLMLPVPERVRHGGHRP